MSTCEDKLNTLVTDSASLVDSSALISADTTFIRSNVSSQSTQLTYVMTDLQATTDSISSLSPKVDELDKKLLSSEDDFKTVKNDLSKILSSVYNSNPDPITVLDYLALIHGNTSSFSQVVSDIESLRLKVVNLNSIIIGNQSNILGNIRILSTKIDSLNSNTEITDIKSSLQRIEEFLGLGGIE